MQEVCVGFDYRMFSNVPNYELFVHVSSSVFGKVLCSIPKRDIVFLFAVSM